MGEWTRKINKHYHDMPKVSGQKGLDSETEVGSIWKCDCNKTFTFMGWDNPPVSRDPRENQRTAQWKENIQHFQGKD